MLAAALREVQAAIGAEDWHAALPLALTAWRLERSSALADLIDRITSRCTLPPPPHTHSAIHRWWMANAAAPDPVMIGALCATWSRRMHAVDATWDDIRARWPTPNPLIEAIAAINPPRYLVQWHARQGTEYVWARNVPNWVDRAAAMITWPDDPRVAGLLATLSCDPRSYLEGEVSAGPWLVIGDKLRALRDRRVGTILARAPHAIRHLRQVDGLAAELAVEPGETSPAIAEVAAGVPRTPDPIDRSRELASLWREVGEHPDDDAPRLVLGDALLAGGDNRGELLVLQCASDPARRQHAEVQARRLLKREWDRWFGDVARLLAKRGTEVRRGMLERIRVGVNDTPPWAWDAAAGHHELVAVREVRPAMAPPVAFAKLVAALPRFPRLLQIDAHEVVETLLETCTNTPLEHLHFSPDTSLLRHGRARPPIEAVYRMLATLAPALKVLDLGATWHGGPYRTVDELAMSQRVELLHLIRALFPTLTRIRISQSSVAHELRAVLAAVPGVELGDFGF